MQASGLDRRAVVKRLLFDRGDLLVVAGLGAPAWDVAAAGDHPLDFPLWGAMGGAAMVGLGLALAQPSRKVLVITGDGEMLMGLGSLATIGAQHPRNLRIIVLDNERYGETGQQHTHTALPTTGQGRPDRRQTGPQCHRRRHAPACSAAGRRCRQSPGRTGNPPACGP